jgi:hypothetical protein
MSCDSTMEPVFASETLQDGEAVHSSRGRGKPLQNWQRNEILQALLSHTKNRELKHGAIAVVAKKFGVTCLTVSKIWKRAKESVKDGGGEMVVSHNKRTVGEG